MKAWTIRIRIIESERMTDAKSLARALRHQATDYARRASVTQYSLLGDCYWRFARHCLMRAGEFERADNSGLGLSSGASDDAP